MSENNNINNKKKRHFRSRVWYAIFSFCFFIVGIFILGKAANIAFTAEGKRWREVGEKETIIKDRIILPRRGNIYTYDGKLLATSEPSYSIYMDFWAGGMNKDTLHHYVSDLSKALAKKFPYRTAAQYKKTILNGWKMREREEAKIKEYKQKGIDKRVPTPSRYVKILPREINYVDLKEIRTFPFWNLRSNKSGLIAEEKNARKKPFGNLATRTVGSVYRDMEKGGASGLELKYDSLLRGIDGVKYRQKVKGRWRDVVEKPAINGYDIRTTIDADIQDIAERALRQKLEETEAAAGTAIIMEVQTGEIKGIANLDRGKNGVYTEGNPNAFSFMSEPGSTFKTITAMVALDEGIVSPTDSFYVGTGLFPYGRRVVRDHYWRSGRDRGFLTLKEGIEISSNIVMSKVVLQGFEDNPKRYVQAIDRIGLRKQLKWDVPLQGIEGTCNIRMPDDKKSYWSKTTLPWMSFGYETQVPPIYMLMFYNAIANNGRMVQPFIAKAIMEDGKVIKEFEANVINEHICKDTTLVLIKEMLEGVVKNGTAKSIASDFFTIAGKTGTAQIASGGSYHGHYVSFCGYFPAEAPMYTIFVGIRRPNTPAGHSAVVFKQIAEQTFVRKVQLKANQARLDSTLQKEPPLKNGNWKQTERILETLNFKYKPSSEVSDWTYNVLDSTHVYSSSPVSVNSGLVPNVKGMGARDAIFLLEKMGLRVNVIGSGKIVSQSQQPGKKIIKGTTISITLQ